MSDTLTRAANDAAGATGLDWRPCTIAGTVYLEAYPHGPEGLGAPVLTQRYSDDMDGRSSALAYLEGLECGARIMRELYRPLVEAAQHMSDYLPRTQGWTDEWDGIDGGTWVGPELAHVAEALANLED